MPQRNAFPNQIVAGTTICPASLKGINGTWASPLQDAHLMAQGDHLKLQRGAATNARNK
jgi:hypothetical protein